LLGLHRNCDHWDVPDNEKETRKRVWWALYITDRFQTAILGRPINLRDEVSFEKKSSIASITVVNMSMQ
jgi:hypothetical protein